MVVLIVHVVLLLTLVSLIMKYLLFTGGVISGIGKGSVLITIGAIAKTNGWGIIFAKK